MGAIYRREMSTYFKSPMAYVVYTVFTFFSAVFFYFYNLGGANTNMTGVFSNMFTVSIFIIPVLTMKLLAEDKKQKTDQLLLTSPTSITGIVIGKYLAALTIFATALIIFIIYAIIMAAYSAIVWQLVFGNIIGLLLLGGAFTAIGLFVSSLTESQIIAAIGSFVIMLLFYMVDMFKYNFDNKFATTIISAISFQSRYNDFTAGIFSLTGVLFFVSVAAIFNFLTIMVLEKRRYA